MFDAPDDLMLEAELLEGGMMDLPIVDELPMEAPEMSDHLLHVAGETMVPGEIDNSGRVEVSPACGTAIAGIIWYLVLSHDMH